MASEAPPFWWRRPDWRARSLYPLSLIYGAAAAWRMRSARRAPIDLPVLCLGNFTVGGSGKTPAAIALAAAAGRRGLKPGFLSRGHGGARLAPRLVDARHDSARQVGDEPLLLAAHAPVAVTPDRAAGARLLIDAGCDFLVMDDGFQSAHIHIDYALVVVDARYGIGNGRVIPAGPLRAPLLDQLRFADAVLRMGEGDAADQVVRQAARAAKPVFDATLRPRDRKRFAGRRFLAYAGIGHPEKFFDSVAAAGGTVALARSFPDHHFYGDDEIADLDAVARSGDLDIVTTAKDAVRLKGGSPAMQAFADRLYVLEVEAVFEAGHVPGRIVAETVEAWRRRRHS